MINTDKLDVSVRYIRHFISTILYEKSLNGVVFEVTGGVDSALVAALCSHFEQAVPVFFHENFSTILSAERARQVAKDCNLSLIEVNLNSPFTGLISQLPSEKDYGKRKVHHKAMFSCLKTAVLDNLAKMHNGLIVGAANRDEDMLLRHYFRRGSGGSADLYPIADLYKSEVRQLASHLGIDRKISESDTTLDLWGGDETRPQPDLNSRWLTTSEIEWARREIDRWLEQEATRFEAVVGSSTKFFGNLLDRRDEKLYFPAHWTKDQKELMECVVNTEYSSRHKINPTVPVCLIPEIFRENENGNSST